MPTKNTLLLIIAKFGDRTFFSFYHLDGVTALITDDQIPEEKKLKLEEFVKVIY